MTLPLSRFLLAVSLTLLPGCGGQPESPTAIQGTPTHTFVLVEPAHE